jgi:dTDP-4-dehydrorhamnose 3,5-epimerase
MIFSETTLLGAYIIDIEKMNDERGFFARVWDKNEFLKKGLDSKFVQSSISKNKIRGTFRGMHYQTKPYEESKLIRCSKGKIFDIIIDLRTNSKTFKKWISIELSEDNYKMVYIPNGFAHGFQTLEDNTEVIYQISEDYKPELSKGILWNDSEFNIKLPLNISMISQRDLSHRSFNQRYQK